MLAKYPNFCYDTNVVFFSNIFPEQLGGATMAKCAICEKGAHFGIKVSHSHRRSNKMWKANVQPVRVKVNGGTRRINLCTSCLRSGLVERA
jgi:large subunit ribosomal protein L28